MSTHDIIDSRKEKLVCHINRILSSTESARFAAGCRSQQFVKLFPGDAGLADERAQRAFGQFAMVGNAQAPARRLAQDDMAAGLMVHLVTELSEGLDCVCAGTDGQPAHTVTSTISSTIGPGTGSLCFSRL